MKSEIKPWGYFITLAFNEKVTVKLITIYKGKRNSLQTHKNRDEYWQVIKGKIKAYVNDMIHTLDIDNSVEVKKNEKHRFEGLEDENVLLEVCRGEFNELDIKRLEDDFGRDNIEFYGDGRDD